ncbi:MAG: hypothetical protein J0H66_10690 [Solirubrobacterales bacterium]|nr:hypothetical protein [Solirubrobacterales bacterium]
MNHGKSARATALRNLSPLVALMVIALIGAGCSGESPESDSAGGQTASDRDKAVKFAECIRAHGVSDFPDPNDDNQFDYGVSVTPAVWKRATTACKDLQPPGTLSAKRTPEEQSASLRFAQCVRDNGVKDFPDPVNGEPLVNTYKIPSSNRPGGMDILNAAMDKCGDVLEEAAGGQG